MQPKPVDNGPQKETHEKESSYRISSAMISNSILSIGDLFKDVGSGPKSVKFPEKLLKVLEQKLQDIAMGKDPGCVVARFCSLGGGLISK